MEYTYKIIYEKSGHKIAVFNRGNFGSILGLEGKIDIIDLRNLLIGNGYKMVEIEY